MRLSRVARRAALAALLPLSACDAPAPRAAAAPADSAVVVTDDAGREVRLPRPAARIVSLVPSATDVLVALGARPRLAGRTDYDTDPAVAGLPSVGGGIDPSLEALVALRPDLVVTWETAGGGPVRERVEALGIPTYAVEATDTADVFRTIAALGALAGRRPQADSLAASIRAELAAVRASVAGRAPVSVFYVVWHDPPMTAGPGTFVDELVTLAGGRSIFADATEPWPTVALEEVVRRDPAVVIVPAGEDPALAVERVAGAPGWREVRALREGRARTVPTLVTNRPGPRLGEAARLLRDALHGEAGAP